MWKLTFNYDFGAKSTFIMLQAPRIKRQTQTQIKFKMPSFNFRF